MDDSKRTRPRTGVTDDIIELWPQLQAGIRYLGRKSGDEPMKQFPFVPARDLVRCKVGNTVWYVHRGWLFGNWPRKVGDWR